MTDVDLTQRDDDARGRAAEARDRAAEARDRAAEARERAEAAGIPPGVGDGTPASDRAASASDREHSANDRVASAEDRVASSFDDLTGAHRRARGMGEAGREIARARRFGQRLTFVFVDVDGLKAFNDDHGHAAGDELLREVGDQIRRRLRSYDLFVRYGGDEFVCVLSDVDMDEATKRFGVVNAALATGPIHGHVSVGVVELGPNETAEDAIARADAAMYQGRAERGHKPRHQPASNGVISLSVL